jgi:hypothetical protein
VSFARATLTTELAHCAWTGSATTEPQLAHAGLPPQKRRADLIRVIDGSGTDLADSAFLCLAFGHVARVGSADLRRTWPQFGFFRRALREQARRENGEPATARRSRRPPSALALRGLAVLEMTPDLDSATL